MSKFKEDLRSGCNYILKSMELKKLTISIVKAFIVVQKDCPKYGILGCRRYHFVLIEVAIVSLSTKVSDVNAYCDFLGAKEN